MVKLKSRQPKKSTFISQCLNCASLLQEGDKFCSSCGQENKPKRMPLWYFLEDFLSNLFSYESNLFKTFPNLIYRPGRLTNKFNEGKRKLYINPIRLYLISSLFYFFVFSLIIPRDFIDDLLGENMDFKIYQEINESDLKQQAKLQSILNKNDSKYLLNSPEKSKKTDYKTLKKSAQDPDVSDSEFQKMLKSSNFSWLLSSPIKKPRLLIANSYEYISTLTKNLPVLMFVLLPIFALILKLLYIRRDYFFIEHLIHALHLHSLAYWIYGFITLIYQFYFNHSNLITFAFLYVSGYAFISMKNVYQQSWKKTSLKFFILGVVYFGMIATGLVLEIYLTLLLL
jgi:hypothetical protein